jgi:periplasmic protein TonB
VIRRSSGRKDVDQAALSILRLASPFDQFPAELRKQYTELRFAYEWQFLEGNVTEPAADSSP